MGKSTERSNFGLHEGHAFINLAKTYPGLYGVIFEGVQNALDSRAIGISITLNYERRTLSIRDNGDGVTEEKFEKALNSVCRTIKKDDALGRFGLGLISPLGKCEQFTFTSTVKSNPQGYVRWTFVTADIERQEKVTGIPKEKVGNLIYGFSGSTPRGRQQIVWRTEVALTNIVKDRTITSVKADEVSSGIITKFGERMRKLGAVVILKIIMADGSEVSRTITAPKFTGTPLKVVKYQGKDCGETRFELYIAPKLGGKRRNGKVSIGILHDDFRIGLADFSRQSSKLLSAEVHDILASGIFEGSVLSQKCGLLENRLGFAENDALVEFIMHLEQWIKEVGAAHISSVTDTQKDERYQAVGIQAIRLIEDMLKTDQFSDLMQVVKSFRMGTIGSGHSEIGTVYSPQKQPSLATIGGTGGERKKTPDSEPQKTNGTPKHRPGQIHNTVAGPQGFRRRVVRGHSTGLQFSYEEMPGESALWKFDVSHGVLSFNVRHPHWERAEKGSDRILMRLQEHIAISALTLELMPGDVRENCRFFVDSGMEAMLYLIEREHPFVRANMARKGVKEKK